MSARDKKKLLVRLAACMETVQELTDNDGYSLNDTFHRLPLRSLVDYFRIVKRPILFHQISRNILGNKYATGQEFVNDLIQVCWNARLYNHRDLRIFHQALVLKHHILTEVIPKLQNEKLVPDHLSITYTLFGDLPDGPDEPMVDEVLLTQPVKNDEFAPEPLPLRLATSTPVPTVNMLMVGQRHLTPNHHKQKAVELGIRRGRPPIIDKPFEIRIKLILKAFKKLRDPNNELRLLVQHFEKLPDAKYNPQYYQVIQNPISLNEIKVKVRLRKYSNVDQFINDLNLMFANTKQFYEHDPYSEEYMDFENFNREAGMIIQQEISKSEQELISALTLGNDGVIRIPYDKMEINGYTYKIGDWVLIQNPNDPEKPTVGQIFRLWSTDDGNKYTNVCWYYRPEQTCHKEDRLFFMNEVCKTGQYRDHLVSEIVGPCYVVFLTRYQKGDLPDGVIPDGAPWFICEFRYNELSHVFNRIRTWKACLPDEVRDSYEQPLIPLHEPRKLIKYESPIRALLPRDSYVGMPIPEPTQGPLQNTPPLAGSVFLDEAVPTDDLGQYISSPNVTEMPERNDPALGRRAYLFTPISQLKGGGGASLAHYVNNNYNGMQALSAATAAAASIGIAPPASVAPLTISDQNLNSEAFAQLGFKPLQIQMQDQSKRVMDQQMMFPQQQQQLFRRAGDFATLQPPQTKTLIYLTNFHGGVVSYAIPDVDGSLSAASEQVTKRIRLTEQGDEETDIVFFRAPPSAVPTNRIVTNNGIEFGHLAKYLAWKLKRAHV